jgi:adenosylcobinamide kinase / adenosylcobinamide-phosphate guanylyltransferase
MRGGGAGAWEGAAADDPEPGDLRIAPIGRFLGRRRGPVTTPKKGEKRARLAAVTLVLGGARSGKSRYAEDLIVAAAECGTYCATAQALDAEMSARIAAHKAHRSSFWRTIEEPLAVAALIAAEARRERPLLIDCLTLWLSNVMLAGRSADDETALLGGALRLARGPVVLVANEVGMGLVPETALGRRFRDVAGRLNQDMAALADRVVFIAAGLPLVLKGAP